MRGVFFVLALFLGVSPASAQTGLTPASQAAHFCAAAMRFRAAGYGDGTAINTACGSGSALAATVATGLTGINSVIALIATARAARNTALTHGTP